jgi:hypothetical protein
MPFKTSQGGDGIGDYQETIKKQIAIDRKVNNLHSPAYLRGMQAKTAKDIKLK